MRLLIPILLLICCSPVFSQTALIDSLQQVITTEKKDVQTLRAYQALVNEYSRTNLAKAKSYAHEGLVITRDQQMWTLLSGFYFQLVSLHQNTGNTDSVHIYLQQMRALAQTTPGKEREKVLGNYYSASGLFYKKQGNYKAALPFLLKSAELAPKISTPEATAGQYLNVGNTYVNIGAYGKALHYHLKALRIFETIGNKKGQSFCFQGIGEGFIELGQYDKAMIYIKKSLNIKNELGDKKGVSNALSGLGRIYHGLKKYDQAFTYLTDALNITKELQLKREEGKILMSMGLLLADKNEVESAMNFYRKGRQLAIESNDSAAIVLANRQISAIQKTQKAQVTAEKQLVSNINTTQLAGNKKEELLLYKTLSDLYAKNGAADKSLMYTKKYYEGRDSLLSKEVQMEVSRLEEQYKHEKKEAEIALLKKDQQLIQAQLKRQKDIKFALIFFAILLFILALLLINRYRVVSKAKRVIEMEKMRNQIAKDLHDDIGSTLSSINIMSGVMLQQFDNGLADTNGLRKIKENSSAIMESMSDIVWAINPQNDTVEKVIFKMKEFASDLLEPLNIRYSFVEKGNFSSLQLDAQKRKDIYMVFKETINNAAKYSGCKNIQIVLEHDGQSLVLVIKDDGKGFDAQKIKKGNGLKNIDERVFSMEGSIRRISSEGNGTKIKMEVPIT